MVNTSTLFGRWRLLLTVRVNMERLFRYIVAISTVSFLVLWLIPYFDYLWLSQEELRLVSVDTYGSYIPNHPLIYWGLFVIWLALSLGLFFYVRAARIGFFIMIIIAVLASFFWGFRVYLPIEVVLSMIVTLSDGAILVMAYLTSVSRKFERKLNNSNSKGSGSN